MGNRVMGKSGNLYRGDWIGSIPPSNLPGYPNSRLSNARFERSSRHGDASRTGRDAVGREQTIDTLSRSCSEETYEVLDAIDRHDHGAPARSSRFSSKRCFWQLDRRRSLRDCRLADERRRQAGPAPPQSYRREAGDAAVDSADRVRTRWERFKGAGGRRQATLTSPRPVERHRADLPAFLRASHIRHARGLRGFHGRGRAKLLEKIPGGSRELRKVWRERVGGAIDHVRAEEEMGDLLLAIANLARKAAHRTRTA